MPQGLGRRPFFDGILRIEAKEHAIGPVRTLNQSEMRCRAVSDSASWVLMFRYKTRSLLLSAAMFTPSPNITLVTSG